MTAFGSDPLQPADTYVFDAFVIVIKISQGSAWMQERL